MCTSSSSSLASRWDTSVMVLLLSLIHISKRAAALAGSFPAVVFDPGHLSLVKGAPEGRRKFLDAALCQLYLSLIHIWYISGIIYMVSFMLPCICWPEAFILMWVDRNMVMTDSSGST